MDDVILARLEGVEASLTSVARLESRVSALTETVERLSKALTAQIELANADIKHLKSRPASPPIDRGTLRAIAEATGDSINAAVDSVRSETKREILSIKSSAGAAANAAANAANASITAAAKTLTGFARNFAYGRA